MKAWKKALIGVGALAVVAIIVGFTVRQSRKNVVTVQTSKVQRQDLATVVSASGEIKPKTYVNIGANAYGKITHLFRLDLMNSVEDHHAGGDFGGIVLELSLPFFSPPDAEGCLDTSDDRARQNPAATAGTPQSCRPTWAPSCWPTLPGASTRLQRNRGSEYALRTACGRAVRAVRRPAQMRLHG